LRNGDKAVILAEQANRSSDNKDPGMLRILAAAFAAAGRFPEAVTTAEKALELAAAESKANLAMALQKDIQLYQTNSPYRSTKY